MNDPRIEVWAWPDVPFLLIQAVQNEDGSLDDVDWIALIPRAWNIPEWLRGRDFAICAADEYQLDDGRAIIVARHA